MLFLNNQRKTKHFPICPLSHSYRFHFLVLVHSYDCQAEPVLKKATRNLLWSENLNNLITLHYIICVYVDASRSQNDISVQIT